MQILLVVHLLFPLPLVIVDGNVWKALDHVRGMLSWKHQSWPINAIVQGDMGRYKRKSQWGHSRPRKKILRYIERQKRGQDWNNSYLSLMTDVQNKSPAAITTKQTATVNTEATGCCTIRSWIGCKFTLAVITLLLRICCEYNKQKQNYVEIDTVFNKNPQWRRCKWCWYFFAILPKFPFLKIR